MVRVSERTRSRLVFTKMDINKVDKKYPASIEHLDFNERIESAAWCFSQFDQNDVNLWPRDGKNCFYFRTEKQAMWFTMRWS